MGGGKIQIKAKKNYMFFSWLRISNIRKPAAKITARQLKMMTWIVRFIKVSCPLFHQRTVKNRSDMLMLYRLSYFRSLAPFSKGMH